MKFSLIFLSVADWVFRTALLTRMSSNALEAEISF